MHVPEGATPKDGPSAGVAMATAIVSVLTGIPVSADVAMTGEITLRGRVLPIGGLKEKLLAALRGGIKKVLIPEDNAKDLAEIPDNVKSGLEIIPVSRVGEVLKHALVRMPEPIEWVEPAEPASPSVDVGDDTGSVNLRALGRPNDKPETKAGPKGPAFLCRKPGKSKQNDTFFPSGILVRGTTLFRVRFLPVESIVRS